MRRNALLFLLPLLTAGLSVGLSAGHAVSAQRSPMAQSPAQLRAENEQAFWTKQADELDKHAERAYEAGFYQSAKQVWLMLLSEYDTNNENARAKLGYYRTGRSWQMKPGFVYPGSDSTDAGKAKALGKKWDTLRIKLAAVHEREAKRHDKAGRTEAAKEHWKMVLRFAPDEAEAQTALGIDYSAGLGGTELNNFLIERSKLIDKAIAEETRRDHEVKVLGEGVASPMLQKSGIPYVTVQSEHFTVHGDLRIGTEWDTDILVRAALEAERAVAVMDRILEGYEGFQRDPDTWVREWAYFGDMKTYQAVLRSNADVMDPEQLEFLAQYTSAGYIWDPTNRTAMHLASPQGELGIYDVSVRTVAQQYSGLKSPAMAEGIGHTIVGLIFNNNRMFIVDRSKRLESSTGKEDVNLLSPSLDTWTLLAREAAWKLGEGTSAAELPLITADKFPEDARIKSWSFCDYVVRRNPSLLVDLDRLREVNHEVEVEKQFTAAHDGLSLHDLELEWKAYWTGTLAQIRAGGVDATGLSAVTKAVEKWVESFNSARMTLMTGTEVDWSEAFTTRCAEHIRYLLANEDLRGADAEQSQDIDRAGASHLGDLWAHAALVDTTGKKPREVFANWLAYPGYRDALLNPALRTIGLAYEGDILAMDVSRGMGTPPPERQGSRFYPDPETTIPVEVSVADLGSEVREWLDKQGRGDLQVLGYPLSMHNFGKGGVPGLRDSYACKLTYRGVDVPGLIHIADGGENRRSSAPGLVVFYPLLPLERGRQYQMVWSWEDSRGPTEFVIVFNT